MLRLALDLHDPVQRRRLEGIFSGAYQVRRALQRTARDRVRAYWAATKARARSASETRARLGLSREALEQAAYAHLDAAPHLRRNVTKALAMHLADSVWTPVERHLFPDAKGKRQGLLRVGRWFDFSRLPGRARSHTRERKWETFRLHGSLAGHRGRYTRPGGDFVQPRHLQVPGAADRRVDWWSYQGPLALVSSAASPEAPWSCRFASPPRRATSPSSTITWPTRPAGTRSTWCVRGRLMRPVAGGTRRI
ncbi:MAG: hypothetical protein QM767_29720 [Anaeromyxobacter sp.]